MSNIKRKSHLIKYYFQTVNSNQLLLYNKFYKYKLPDTKNAIALYIVYVGGNLFRQDINAGTECVDFTVL